MAYKVEFAGRELHEYVTILNVNRRFPERMNFTKDISGVHGKHYIGYKYSEKIIKLECLIIAQEREDKVEILNEVAFLLDVAEPQKLVIDDNPNVFCYAVPKSIGDIESVGYGGKFDIEFVCYDPYNYAIEDDYFDADSEGIVTVENGGTANTYPIIDTVFQKNTNFFMVTNYDSKTILLGNPIDEETLDRPVNPKVMTEPCETLENFTNVSSDILDEGRVVTGNLQVNESGKSIMCGNFGQDENGWHGGALRRNIGTSVSDFEFRVRVQHNSKGDLYINDGTAVANKKGTFTVTAKNGQTVYKDRNTKSGKVTTIPKGKVVTVSEITKDWGKVTYSGKTGYVDTSKMKYGKASTSTYPKTLKGTVNATNNLYLRKGKGTKYKALIKIPNKTSLTLTQEKEKDTWLKTTYKGKTGYVAKQYIKISSSSKMITRTSSEESAERQKGRVEIYGFSKTGDKLFKCIMRDSSKYYEYSQPEIWIGNELVLHDNKTTPDPKTRKEVNKDGKTITKKLNSGKYGNWNEFNGWFTVKRTSDKRGKHMWECKVEKLKDDGTVERKLVFKKSTTTTYPRGELASIVVWIGQWKDEPTVTTMQCSHMEVKNLKTQQQEIIPIFTEGDHLLIDNEEQKIYLNGSLFMNSLDIGSEFFSSPVGESQFQCVTDGGNLDIGVSIKKRWV